MKGVYVKIPNVFSRQQKGLRSLKREGEGEALVSVSGKWKGNKKGTKNKTEVYGYLPPAPRTEPSTSSLLAKHSMALPGFPATLEFLNM